MEATTLILALATLAGLYMAWNIGANDVANAMGTSVGSGALTLRGAIIVAAIFEFGGAMLVGGTVTDTVRKGIVSLDAIGGDPMVLAVGMTACLLSAAIWLHVATYFGWPVSTTHSIVGAVVGFGITASGLSAVNWGVMASIVASWVISPLMGGVIAYLLFRLLRKRVLDDEEPIEALARFGPWLIFVLGFVLALALLWKGLKPLHLDLPIGSALPIALGAGVVAGLISAPLLKRRTRAIEDGGSHDPERVFLFLQILTACFVAFAHGSNDVANAVGPLSAVYGAIEHGVSEQVTVPMGMLLVGAVGIVIGLATYGYKVMATIGREITELTPSRGFVAEFAAATTIVAASKLGLPVSTTHTLVGAVVGVGFARSLGALDLGVVRGIMLSWFITVPFAALLAAGLFSLGRLAL
ncbi:MAG: inorganic phosphate transporter [Deltaproteobacteria bacterium]|nr:inorganic phosphate transporter [Deltaproteobacteria bacterium]